MSIHEYYTDVWLPKLEEKIRTAEYSKGNRDLILKFETCLFSESLKSLRVLKYLFVMDKVARMSEVSFSKMNESNIQKIIADFERSELAASTKRDYKVIMTGARRVRMTFAASYLTAWLDVHPQKTKSESFVFLNLEGVKKGEQIQYCNFQYTIRKIAMNAGINKRINPHLFRHSRSTELAQYLTEAQLEEHLGWTQGSEMPRTYFYLRLIRFFDVVCFSAARTVPIEPALTGHDPKSATTVLTVHILPPREEV